MIRREILLRAKRQVLLSRERLLPFAQWVRPNPKNPQDPTASLYEIAEHHELIAEKLEALERGDIKRLIISVPPRHGKTELASKTYIPWCAGRNPRWSFIVATYNQNFAGDFGRAVRDLMQNPRFLDVFPETALRPGSASANRLETELGALFAFVGRGGALTGRGGHMIVVDDPLKDRKEADSQVIRDHLWLWWTQVLSTRLMTDEGRILLIQTRWHEDDLVGRLTDPNNPSYNADEAAKWTVINLPALAVDDPDEPDPLGRAPGEPLWPARFSVPYLTALRNQDARGFSALYQGQPTPGDGLFFTPEDIIEYQSMQALPRDLRYYAASDHAISQNQWADKSVFIPFATDHNDDIWIMPDAALHKLPADQAVELMLRMILKYKPMFWWAEKGHISKAIGPFLRKRMQEEGVYTSLVELTPQMDKQARAQSIKGRMSQGKVHFPAWAPWYAEARHQLLSFPAGAKDDFVDAMSMIGLGLALQVVARAAKPRMRDPAPYTLGWIKNQSREADRHARLRREQQGW